MVYCHLTLLTDESLLVMHQQWMPLLESVPPSMAQTFTLSVKCNSRARMHLKHPKNIIYLILCQDGKHFFVQKIHCESFLPKIYFVRFVPAGQMKTEKGEFKTNIKNQNQKQGDSGPGMSNPGGCGNNDSLSPCILHEQSSEGTKNRNLTLFKYRIWDIKAGLILE